MRILRYLKMPSTWKGITWLITVVGISLSPEQIEMIALAGMTIVGLIETFIDEDDKRPININLPPVELQGKSQFDERGFNEQSRHDRDDGYVSRDVLRSGLRVAMPPDHIAGSVHDERREAGFGDRESGGGV